MRHTITETVHVDLRAAGQDYTGDYGPGDVDLPDPVAELLTAQGLAEPAPRARPRSRSTEPADSSPDNPEA